MVLLQELLIGSDSEAYEEKKRSLPPRSLYYYSLAEFVFKESLQTIPSFKSGLINYTFSNLVSVEGSTGSGKTNNLKKLVEDLSNKGYDITIKSSYPNCLPVDILLNLALPEYSKFRNPIGRLFLATSKLLYKYESMSNENNEDALVVEDRGKYSFLSIMNNLFFRNNYANIGPILLELNKEFPEPALVLLLHGDTHEFCQRIRTRTGHKYVAFRIDRNDQEIILELDHFYLSIERWLRDLNANHKSIESCRPSNTVFSDFFREINPYFKNKVKIYME